MSNENRVPKAQEVVTAAEAVLEINRLIEEGNLDTYTQICLIRAMAALNGSEDRGND